MTLYVALGCGDLAIGKIINHIQEVEKGTEDPLFLHFTYCVERKRH
jgi:hypothetical protein